MAGAFLRESLPLLLSDTPPPSRGIVLRVVDDRLFKEAADCATPLWRRATSTAANARNLSKLDMSGLCQAWNGIWAYFSKLAHFPSRAQSLSVLVADIFVCMYERSGPTSSAVGSDFHSSAIIKLVARFIRNKTLTTIQATLILLIVQSRNHCVSATYFSFASLSSSPSCGFGGYHALSRAVQTMDVKRTTLSWCRTGMKLLIEERGSDQEWGTDEWQTNTKKNLHKDGINVQVEELNWDPESPLGLLCVPQDCDGMRKALQVSDATNAMPEIRRAALIGTKMTFTILHSKYQ